MIVRVEKLARGANQVRRTGCGAAGHELNQREYTIMPLTHEKVYTVTVGVADPVHFSTDKRGHILAALRDAYVGRCFGGAYITGVARILRASAIGIVSTNATGAGTVEVQFVATVVVFAVGDVLVGVNVFRTAQMIIGLYEGAAPAAGAAPARAVVVVTASRAAEAAAVGNRLAVRITAVSHTPMQNCASVAAAVLTCDVEPPLAYRVVGVLGPDARADFDATLAAVDAERARVAALPAERVEFFERLLYAYRDAAPPAADDGAAVDVVELVRAAVHGLQGGGQSARESQAGVWSRPLRLRRSSPLAHRHTGADADTKAAADAVDTPARVAFAALLHDVLSAITAIRELTEAFADDAERDAHANIWAALRAAQQ